MEETLMNAGITTSGVAIILIIYKVIKAAKGHLLVSRCCGKKIEVGFDVTDVVETPKEPQIVIHNPMKNEK